MRKHKILIITGGLTKGGVDSLLLNLMDAIDLKRYAVDFLIFDYSKDDCAAEYEKYGSRIYKIMRMRKRGLFKSIKDYKQIIKEGKYEIVHSQIGFGGIIPLLACRKEKQCHFIAHSHYDHYPVNWFVKLMGRFLFNSIPCTKLACSIGAGMELYGKRSHFTFLKNGIDTKKYAFCVDDREKVRKKLGFEKSDFVVGTVGRIEYQKNYEFIIDTYVQIRKRTDNAKLLLIGDGTLKKEMEDKVAAENIEDVIFLGARNDVDKLLLAMDVFLMPTRYEGLSMSLLEVQCSGLPCITSTAVPKEVKVTDTINFLDLNLGHEKWADCSIQYLGYKRHNCSESVVKAGFDKQTAIHEWIEIYDRIIV